MNHPYLARTCLLSVLLVLLASCGDAAPRPGASHVSPVATVPPLETQPPESFTATFRPGRIVYAVEATLQLDAVLEIEAISFSVHTKPGGNSDDVRVTLERSYLDRNGSIDAAQGAVRFPLFGLYEAYENDVSIVVNFVGGRAIERSFAIQTPAAPAGQAAPQVLVESVDATLDVSFLLMQVFGAPRVFDIDGELRWVGPEFPEAVFPKSLTRDGFCLGATVSGALYRCDWLGNIQSSHMSDPRYIASHHNFSPGKTGILNTVSVQEPAVSRRLSVLAEMTETGETIREWNFDEIFGSTILAAGEDPSAFVKLGRNWFHMNAAIYDPSDDSVLASSRENFVVKSDHATGEIKWILGNPGKLWYTGYPQSLQPLALTVIGDPPIGQHALSVSADGQFLMLFNNGNGNSGLPSVGDTRGYSKVSVYRIDDVARTAEEVWTYGEEENVYSPICSSAYRTTAGHVLVTYSSPQGMDPFVVVVDSGRSELFRASILGGGCSTAYAVEELGLGDLVLD